MGLAQARPNYSIYIHVLCIFVSHCVADGSGVPSHWYRMKVFDEAADFGKSTLKALLHYGETAHDVHVLCVLVLYMYVCTCMCVHVL